MKVFDRIIKGVKEFPTLPTVFQALSDVLANPNSTASDAAEVISSDQASAAKILKCANSPIYGFSGRIDNITKAIFYIGFQEVKNLILAIAIIDIFKKSKLEVDFNPVDLWKHSIAVGVITRLIGEASGIKNVESYFVTGILHDIGKLLFIRTIDEEYYKAMLYAYENQVSIREAEAEMLGITHTVAGELIAEKWKLPKQIKDAIRYHYSGTVNGKVEHLAASVHVANLCARFLQLGNPGDAIIPEPNEEVWNVLNLPHDTFTTNYKRILGSFDQTVHTFLLS
jgi:putative nucleotidyltransferase with HDIG domain